MLYGYEVIQVRTVGGWMLRPKGLHLYPRMLGTYPGGCGSRATSAKTCALGRKLPANYSAGLHIFRDSGPADSSPRSPKPMVCVWRFQGASQLWLSQTARIQPLAKCALPTRRLVVNENVLAGAAFDSGAVATPAAPKADKANAASSVRP